MFLYVAFGVLLIYGIAILRSERLMPKGTEWLLPALLLGLGLGLRLYLILQRVSLTAGISDVLSFGQKSGFVGGVRYCTSFLPIPLQLIAFLCTFIPNESASVFRVFCIFVSITGAWSCQRVVQSVSSRASSRLVAFILYFFLPSVVLADAAGSGVQFCLCFLLLALDCLLRSKAIPGATFLGLAIAFRPGLALLLPLMLVFKACSAHKWRFYLISVGAWFAAGIPSVLIGRTPDKIYPLWPSLPELFTLSPSRGCPGVFSTGLFDFPAVVGILLFAGATVLLIWFLGRRSLLRDKRGQLGAVALTSLIGCIFLPWTDPFSLLAAEALLAVLCCTASGAILCAVCVFLSSGVTLCRLYLPALSIPYSDLPVFGGLSLGFLLLLLYLFGRPVKSSR